MKTNPANLELDPAIFWRLNDTPRFPATTMEWTRTISIETEQACLAGALLEELRHTGPLGVPTGLTPQEWRLAYYHRPMSSTAWDKMIEAICAECRPDGWLTDVPEEWIGAESTLAVCESLAASIRRLSKDEAKALTKLLRLFRAISLEKHEVLRLPWFDPNWVQCFTTHVIFRQITHVPSLAL